MPTESDKIGLSELELREIAGYAADCARGRCRSSNSIFLQTRALATPSMQHRLSLRAASAPALCGRAVGRRTERLKKPLHPLRSKRHERQAMRLALRSFIL